MKESLRHIYILLLLLVSISAHADSQFNFTVINATNVLAANSAQTIFTTFFFHKTMEPPCDYREEKSDM